MDSLYIDYLNYQEYGTRNAKVLSTEKGSLTEAKLSRLFSMIEQGKIKLVNAESRSNVGSISVYIDGSNAHIEVLDDEEEARFVYDNLLEDDSDVGIGGYDFPKWSICQDLRILNAILKKFLTSGEKLSTVSWREDW